MHTILDRLGIGHGHEADADRGVVVGSDDDLALALGQDLPAQRLRPEPGQARQVVSVNDDVVQSDRHANSLLGPTGWWLRGSAGRAFRGSAGGTPRRGRTPTRG